METIKIGYVGLGCRGTWLLKDVVLAQGEEVVAVCDVYEDRAKEGAKLVAEAGQKSQRFIPITDSFSQTMRSR